MSDTTTGRGLTPNELARRYGVGVHKVLGWIGRGELRAVNVATDASARPQWVVCPSISRYLRTGARQDQSRRRRGDGKQKTQTWSSIFKRPPTDNLRASMVPKDSPDES